MKAQRLLCPLRVFPLHIPHRGGRQIQIYVSRAQSRRHRKARSCDGLFSIYRKSAQRTHQGYRHTPAPVKAQCGQRTSVKTAAVPSDRTGTAAISAPPTSTSQGVKNSQEETFSDPLAQLFSPGPVSARTHSHKGAARTTLAEEKTGRSEQIQKGLR